MEEKTRRRSAVKERRREDIVSFRSKTLLRSEGFIEGKFLIQLKNGSIYQEYGYSRVAIVKGSEDDLIEDARLNASSKVLYREGYFVGKENYENLDQEQLESVKLITYVIHYIRNEEFNDFTEFKDRSGKVQVAERDQFGRFKSRTPKSDGKPLIEDFNKVN